MQYKTVLLGLVIACFGLRGKSETAPLSRDTDEESQHVQHKNEALGERLEANEAVDEILALLDEKGIQTPVISPPSMFMRWIRSFGISVLYKYYAVKSWIVGEESEII